MWPYTADCLSKIEYYQDSVWVASRDRITFAIFYCTPMNSEKASPIVSLICKAVRHHVVVITSLNPFGLQAQKLAILSNDFCRDCKAVKEKARVYYLICT